MINSLQNSTSTRVTTSHYKEDHTKHNIYKPGGVAQLILKPLTTRINTVGSDDLGRWAWQELRLDGARSLFIVTAYRPCPRSNNSKFTTTWDQQHRGLLRRNITDPDPRQQFIDDLTKFLRRLEQNGHEIILGVDFNDPHDSDEWLDFLQVTNLVDLHDDFFDRRPPTYFRGSTQVDMFAGTISLRPYLVNAFIIHPEKNTHSPGDHSCIGGDLNFGGLINRDDIRSLDPTNMQNRLLASTDVKATARYLSHLNKQLEAHNVSHRLSLLQQRCDRTQRCTEADEETFQKLCHQLYDFALQAENQCKRTGPSPWSPMLAAAGETVLIAGKELTRIIRGGTPTNPQDDRDSAVLKAKANLALARAMSNDVKCRAQDCRDTHLELKAVKYAEDNNITKAEALSQLQRREHLRQLFLKLGYHYKAIQTSSLDRVLTPDDPTDLDNTTWTAVLESQAIYEALLQHGKEHFSQASDTPFASGPISTKIGPFEFNESSEQILQGTFDIDSLTDCVYMRDIIKSMRHDDPCNPPELNCDLTVDDLKQGFKNIKESTSSSPSGLHHGHWKTFLQDDTIFDIYAAMIIFSFKWGVPPEPWEKAVQCLIEKDAGRPRINRLRRIQLLDAAMNMGFRIIFGHRMLKLAERTGTLSSYQFGARSGHMSLGAALLKRLSYDIARLFVAILVAFDNDAGACYDRMIPSMCMLLAAQNGVTNGPIQVHLKVLDRMKFHIKTSYGVSEDFFQNSEVQLILGLLQGSAAVGALWGLVSGLLLRVLDKHFPPTQFRSPQPWIFTERNGEAFVDDTTLWEIQYGDPTQTTTRIQTIVPRMEKKAQAWATLLGISGGILNLKKCFWYLFAWKWTDTGAAIPLKLDDTPDIDIHITQGNGSARPIERIDVRTGKRTLGVRLAPNGSDTTEHKHRMEQGKKIRKRLMRAPTNREETRTGVESMIRPAIEHSLPITCFSKDQCDKIQGTYFPTALSKMGINNKTPKAVRSGPFLYAGMDKHEVWTTQGTGHDKMLISHLRKDDVVGDNLDRNLDILQLQAGVSWPVLSRNGDQVRSYTPPCWASHTWAFNDMYDLTVHREVEPWLQPQRENDRFIMEELANVPNITSKELKYVQRCRLYLKVTTLADITTSCGTALTDWATTAKSDNPHASLLRYPEQISPNRTIWNEYIRVIQRYLTTGTDNTLKSPLGNWYHGRMTHEWSQEYSPTTKIMYSFESDEVRQYVRRRKQKRFSYLRPIAENLVPDDTVPISGNFEAGYFVPTSTQHVRRVDPPDTPDRDERAKQRMLRTANFRVPSARVAEAIWKGDAIIASDGSAKNDHQTYGVAIIINILSPEPELAVRLGGHLPPLAEMIDADSHRPEAAALYAAHVLVEELLHKHPFIGPHLPTLRIDFCLDNKSVQTDTDWTYDTSTSVFDYLKADYDIIQGIQRYQDLLPIKTRISWVKAHQDRDTQWDELTTDAKANCFADESCTETHLTPIQDSSIFPAWIPGTRAALLHKGLLIPKRQDQSVRFARTAPRHRQYLISKSKRRDPHIQTAWTDETFDDIDWITHGQSFKALSNSRQIQISKYVHEWAPTRSQQRRISNKNDSRCPMCRTFNETSTHVLQCTSLERDTARTKALQDFKQHLSRYHTPLPMATLILDSMETWLEGDNPRAPIYSTNDYDDEIDRRLHTLLRHAFLQQARIGWAHFFRGRLTHAWKPVLARYYTHREPGEKFTPKLWMRKTIDQMWKFYIALWHCRNGELHGHDFEESKRKVLEVTRTTAKRLYREAQEQDNNPEAHILHRTPLEDLLNWTKSHLDAYLATAEVILEQNVDPG